MANSEPQKITLSSIFEACNQIVIYGANGWMGRSAIDCISRIAPNQILQEKVLLIGSKKNQIHLNGVNLNIENPIDGYEQIVSDAIFFNAAFLRREFLHSLSHEVFVRKNNQISALAKKALNEKEIKSFINLSSGVARNNTLYGDLSVLDLYAKLKRTLEDEYFTECSENNAAFINCRIYSISGKHLNEFENLALGSFILQAQNRGKIQIKSPMTKRSYVDSVELAELLLKKAMLGTGDTFDSGGSLVTMRELAQVIKNVLGQNELEIEEEDIYSPDYFGDYRAFDLLAADLCTEISSIETQIVTTLEAFKTL